MSKPTSHFTIEEKLHAATRMPLPRREFVDGLQKRLAEEARQLGTGMNFIRSEPFGQRFLRLFQRPAVAAVLISLLLMVVIILAVGPERVLAQVQRLLGYVPGVGFVDMEMTRILASPVEIAREGVVLRVETVVAEPGRTVVIFSSRGLPEERSVFSPSPEMTTPKPVLYLPDGSILEPVQLRLYYGGGNIEFGAVPEGVYQVTFEIDRLPMTSPGSAPENWQAVLLLQPAIGAPPAEVFPQPYEPEDAFIEAQGVALRILQVAQSPEETGIKVQFEWENKNWDLSTAQYSVKLRDDIGNIYRTKSFYQQGSGAAMAVPIEVESFEDLIGHTSTLEETYQFPPLSLEAREVVLQLTSLNFMALTSTAFTFDPGPNPQVGQTWELDERLEVEGIPLYLTGARLRKDNEYYPGETLYSLEFSFWTPADTSRSLISFMIESDREDHRGSMGGHSLLRETRTSRIEMYFKNIIEEPLHLMIHRANISIEGPWEIRWQIPWTSGPPPPTRMLGPSVTADTQHGLTIGVEQALFSDQSTILTLMVQGLPEGSRLLNFMPFIPREAAPFEWIDISLETDQGNFIGPPSTGISWEPPHSSNDDTPRLIFDAVPHDVEKLTVHIHSVELFLPRRVVFDIDVPGGLDFYPVEFKAPEISSAPGGREETYTRWLSESWEVDIPVEVGGFNLHFTQAQMENWTDSFFTLILTSEPRSREANGMYLGRLNLSTIVRPDGGSQVDKLNELMSWHGYFYDQYWVEDYDPNHWQATLLLDVTNQEGLDVLPGKYRIEISGANVIVPGQWEIGFSVR
jgi:hypothetical protein